MYVDASKLQGEDWGSQDFSHTDWDHEVPLVKGTPKKGRLITLEVPVKCVGSVLETRTVCYV